MHSNNTTRRLPLCALFVVGAVCLMLASSAKAGPDLSTPKVEVGGSNPSTPM
jgi:hypothetical protein